MKNFSIVMYIENVQKISYAAEQITLLTIYKNEPNSHAWKSYLIEKDLQRLEFY